MMRAYQDNDGYFVIDGEGEEIEMRGPMPNESSIIITHFSFINSDNYPEINNHPIIGSMVKSNNEPDDPEQYIINRFEILDL